MANDLDKIWHIDMKLDLTEQDKLEGLDTTVKFTKIGLIDFLLTDEYTKDYVAECLDYSISDDDLKHLISEINYDWKVLSIS